MDKHTIRYLNGRFGSFYEVGDTPSFGDLSSYLNETDNEDDFIYLSSAAKELEDDERKLFKEQLLKKQLGWD